MEREVQERRLRGSEFQRVGAAYEKDLRPAAEVMKGTVSRCLSAERKDLEGW